LIVSKRDAELVARKQLAESIKIAPCSIPKKAISGFDPTEWYIFMYHFEMENHPDTFHYLAVSKLDGSTKYIGSADE
jgi:hypothetical protein